MLNLYSGRNFLSFHLSSAIYLSASFDKSCQYNSHVALYFINGILSKFRKKKKRFGFSPSIASDGLKSSSLHGVGHGVKTDFTGVI